MRSLRAPALIVAILTLACAGSVLAASSTVSYQGRLTSSSGTPVADGPYSVLFSIWTDSTGGSQIWSETQTVQVTGGGGLFSCNLGSLQPLGGPIVIHANDNLYMQTAVSGQTLLPRLRVGMVPYAVSASSVHTSVPGAGSLQMEVGEDTTKSDISHEGAAALIQSSLNLMDDRALLGLKCYGAGQPHPQSCDNSEVDLDHARRSLDRDSDADGINDVSIWEKVDNTGSISESGIDINEDGVIDVGSSSSSKSTRAILKTFFESGDKPTQSRIIDSVDETGAYQGTIRYNGTDFEGSSVSLMPESAVVHTEVSNPSASSSSHMRARINDIEQSLKCLGLLARSSVTQTVTPTTCGVAINTKGTGADKGRTVSTGCNDSAAQQILEVDDDGDGHAEAKAAVSSVSSLGGGGGGGGAQSGAYARMTYDSDDDGIPENEAAMTVTPTTSSVAIKWKGTGADANRTISSTCDDGSAVQIVAVDLDGDAIPEFSTGGKVDDTSSQWSVSQGADVPGNHRDGWNVGVDSKQTREELKQKFQDGDIPTQEQLVDSTGSTFRAINTTGTGATVRTTVAATDGASSEYDADSDGDGNAESHANIGALLNGSVVIGLMRDHDDDGATDVSAETTVNDDSATFRLNALPPGIPVTSTISMAATSSGVHMEVGAATCDGTNWTNASDRNLKENFQDVDGEALLDKISTLAITKWNYKGDKETEHIGPTAQDFQKTFRVGSDGKSISTIDPSGIALAAIKELNRKNEKLEKENRDLRSEMDELKSLVLRLASEK